MTTGDDPFRFHGILIKNRREMKRYADILAVIAEHASLTESHPYVREFISSDSEEDLLTFADIGRNGTKIGCSISSDGKIRFGFMSDDRMVDADPEIIRMIPDEAWLTIEEYTENHARQAAQKEYYRMDPADSLKSAWKAWVKNSREPDIYRVEDLGLTSDGKTVRTAYELVKWYENSRNMDVSDLFEIYDPEEAAAEDAGSNEESDNSGRIYDTDDFLSL